MLQLHLSDATEKKMQQIISLHTDKDYFFNKVIDYQINQLKTGMFNIEKDLKEFELKYSMTTNLFYEKVEKGKIGDEHDYLIWAGIYDMYLKDKQKLNDLEW